MDKKAISLITGVLLLIVIVVAVALAMIYLGVTPLSLINGEKEGDVSKPIGSDKCDYTDGEIINMFENLVGKDLNNDVGFSVVNALNMRACGSNSKLPGEIIGTYMTEFADGWYVLADDTITRSGYYYRSVVWGNTPSLSNSTLIRAVLSGNGEIIKEWYGYETMSITSHGTKSGYIAV